MTPMKSKRGFYLVSPLLGIFIFLITISAAYVVISENLHSMDVAQASPSSDIIFLSQALEADIFDVYFQNYLQKVLDSYQVGSAPAILTDIKNRVKGTIATDLKKTYEEISRKVFEVNCNTTKAMYSHIYITFNAQSSGTDILHTGRQFNPDKTTAVWPFISHYGLRCESEEPPASFEISFKSRWYLLDASNICNQVPAACGLA